MNNLLNKYIKKYQSGNRLLLSVSALAVIVLILGVITLPFNRGLLSKLFPKRLSHAALTTQPGILTATANGTLVNIQLAFAGDDNNNAIATLEYKKTSETNWTAGPTLSRSAVQGVHTSSGAVKAVTTTQSYTAADVILIKFKKEVPDEDRQALRSQYNLRVEQTIQSKDVQDVTEKISKSANFFTQVFRTFFPNHKFRKKLDIEKLKVLPQDRDRIIQELRNNPDVEFAEPDTIGTSLDSPNDPIFQNQLPYLQRIQAPSAWDISTGSPSIIIAVIDSGVNYLHVDLTGPQTTIVGLPAYGRMILGHDYIDNDEDPQDVYGHGTYIAGIIGASTNNATGIAGVARQNEVLIIRDSDASGNFLYSNLISAIQYAADHGAKVINISQGGTTPSSNLTDAVNYALGKGVVVVASAGNGGNSSATLYPAAIPNVISVGATDSNDNLWSGSSLLSSTGVVAPGVGINGTRKAGDYGTGTGTSFSAPHVAGLAGLIYSVKAADPAFTSLPPLQQGQLVWNIIKGSTDLIGGQTGFSQSYGFGRINAQKALLAAQATLPSLSPTLTPTVFLPTNTPIPTIVLPTATPIPTNTPIPTATTAPLPTPTATPTPSLQTLTPTIVSNGGMVGYWNFDEGVGSTVGDSSGNGSNGTWGGTLGSQWTTGQINGAGNFNGVNNYVSIPDPGTNIFDNTSQLSVAAWVYVNVDGTNKIVIGKWPSWLLLRGGGTLDWQVVAGGNTYPCAISAPNTVTVGGWQQLVFTFNGNNSCVLYKNGVQIGIDTTPGASIPDTTVPIVIGDLGANTYFNGKIDDVRIYNRALTPTEVSQLYSGVIPTPTPAPVVFNNQFSATLSNLAPNTAYDIRITVTDPDGLVGSGVVLGQITTGVAPTPAPTSIPTPTPTATPLPSVTPTPIPPTPTNPPVPTATPTSIPPTPTTIVAVTCSSWNFVGPSSPAPTTPADGHIAAKFEVDDIVQGGGIVSVNLTGSNVALYAVNGIYLSNTIDTTSGYTLDLSGTQYGSVYPAKVILYFERINNSVGGSFKTSSLDRAGCRG